MRACVRGFVRACVRACVHACVRVSSVLVSFRSSIVVPVFQCPFSFLLPCFCYLVCVRLCMCVCVSVASNA